MDPLGPVRLEAPRHLGRVDPVEGLLAGAALHQAHDAPLPDVDRRDDDHAALRDASTTRTKLSTMRSPTSWLFSGWNWTPSTLPRPTIAGKSSAVVGGRDHHVGGSVAVVGVDEVDVRAVGDAVEDRVRAPGLQPVPAHVRHRELPLEAPDAAGQEAEAGVASVLLALLEEELHADADAEEGLSLLDRLAQDRHEAPPFDLGHGGRERPVAGQHERVGAAQGLRVPGEQDLRPRAAEALRHAPEVPDAVVGDRDHAPTGSPWWTARP